jgi:amino acid transporter
VFSSDALSSNAYATQEIVFVLMLAGSGALAWSLPIALAITLLFGIVVSSYRQTVRAYPGGGGAYIVAHENFGIGAGLIAAASLLIDYVLTVAVSVAAAMDALASLHEGFRPLAVPLAVASVGLITLVNLRGVRESGTIFAVPTYAFIASLGLAIIVGLIKVIADGENPLAPGAAREPLSAEEGLTILLVLKAFSNGCAALTGVEAISNGVPAFKPPSPKRAANALLLLGLISGFLFLGTTVLARHHGFVPSEDNTIPSQLGSESFGEGTVLFAFLQIMTAGILVLAANTAFADFPRLAAILGRDGYLPRIFHARGNRLVFNAGILVLATLASVLLVAFTAKTTRLIPLYALGVFLSFTLSQWGMARRFRRQPDGGTARSIGVSALGGFVTFVVLLVILEAKFLEGAWVVVILIPGLALCLWLTGRFYRGLRRAFNVPADAAFGELRPAGRDHVPVVVPVEEVDLLAVMTLAAACERSRTVIGVHVIVDPDEESSVERQWREKFPGVPLVVIDSPYRTVAEPLAAFVRDQLRLPPHELVVLLPVVEPRRWWHRPLLNQSLKRLSRLLGGERRIRVEEFRLSPGIRRSTG